MLGMIECFMQLLKISVRNLMPLGPRCFKVTGDRSPGPRSFEFLAFLIAANVCSGVKIIC